MLVLFPYRQYPNPTPKERKNFILLLRRIGIIHIKLRPFSSSLRFSVQERISMERKSYGVLLDEGMSSMNYPFKKS